MPSENLVLLTLDEVRPDHLGCYGYKRIATPNIDRIAREGVLFEQSISSSNFTPVVHASLLTGVHPPFTGVRDPFGFLQARTLSEALRDRGFRTAAFVGSGVVGSQTGFQRGFDLFDEPKPGEESWEVHRYPGAEERGKFVLGNWWVPRLLQWIKDNHGAPFFVWGHFFHTHEGSEHQMLSNGRIEEGQFSEFSYYDAKIQVADRDLVGPLLELLETVGVYETTTIAILSDHGTTLGEHPNPPIPWRHGLVYPQHTSMYDVDLRTAWIMKGRNLPRGRRIGGQVRLVDFTPTVIHLLGYETISQFNGVSLIGTIERGDASGLVAYAEELYDKRGPGDLQAVRTQSYKYIVDRRNDSREEFYDLQADPEEKTNVIDVLDEPEELIRKEARELCDRYLGAGGPSAALSEEDQEKIKARLRMLGYIH